MSTLSPGRLAISSAVALVAACASLFAPTVASATPAAPTWTIRQAPATDQAPLFGISCPTTSLCVAVGGGNTIASSTNPAGTASDWSVVNPGGFMQPNWNEIKGVSCPSPQLCVAVSFDGRVFTSTNPTGGVGAWSVADLSPSGPNTHLYGISCPSPTFCAASAGRAKILTSTNPAGGAAAWSTTQLEGPLELRGISCPSPSFCVVVGDDGDLSSGSGDWGDEGEILTSTNPLGGAWQQVVAAGSPGNLRGVSCPSPALCVTGNALGDLLVSTEPTGPSGAWPATDGGGSVQLTGVDCPAVTGCVAVDNNGDVLTSTDPTDGDWTFTNLIPYAPDPQVRTENAMWGVSCPTVTFCAISAAADRVFTSEDPFAASPAVVKGTGSTGHKKKRRKGPKRPRTTLAKTPPPSQEITSHKVTVRLRFFATDRVHVSGFVCKIDQRPLMRCRSPKNYRVGVGRHHFQVRALGSSGLRGPPARSHFRVCRAPSSPPPASLPPCWKGLPPGWQQ